MGNFATTLAYEGLSAKVWVFFSILSSPSLCPSLWPQRADDWQLAASFSTLPTCSLQLLSTLIWKDIVDNRFLVILSPEMPERPTWPGSVLTGACMECSHTSASLDPRPVSEGLSPSWTQARPGGARLLGHLWLSHCQFFRVFTGD